MPSVSIRSARLRRSNGQRKLATDTLIRRLGRWDLVWLTINSTVGAGILGLPGRVYALVGVYSVLSCIAGGLLMGLVAASFAEASSRFSRTGGPYLYAGAAFGPFAAFMAGWLAVATRLLAFASITNLMIGYAASVVPALVEPAWRIIAITLLAAALGSVIYAGIELSARTNAAFTLTKLTLLGAFVCAAWAFSPKLHFHLPPLPPAGAWAPSVVLLIFGLAGLDSTVVTAGETRDPRRSVPFGLGVGILCVVVLYTAILLACAGVVPNLAHSQRPIVDGAVAMLGPWAGVLVAIAAVISMTGTLFTILVGPRLIFAMAEGGQLPRVLAQIHPHFSTPGRAVILHTSIAWALAVASTFLGALTASTLTRLLLYALSAASLVVLRRRHISEQPNPLLLPGGMACAILAAGLCALLTTQADRGAWVTTLWCLALGASLGLPAVSRRSSA